jgi:hypothetical protein
VQIDPTVKLVLMSVKAHEVSSSPGWFLPMPTVPPWYAEEEASISINRLQATANSIRSCVAAAIGGA